jgi:hypothetical protein
MTIADSRKFIGKSCEWWIAFCFLNIVHNTVCADSNT